MEMEEQFICRRTGKPEKSCDCQTCERSRKAIAEIDSVPVPKVRMRRPLKGAGRILGMRAHHPYGK